MNCSWSYESVYVCVCECVCVRLRVRSREKWGKEEKEGEHDKRGVVEKFAEYDHTNITDSEWQKTQGRDQKIHVGFVAGVERDALKTDRRPAQVHFLKKGGFAQKQAKDGTHCVMK